MLLQCKLIRKDNEDELPIGLESSLSDIEVYLTRYIILQLYCRILENEEAPNQGALF